MSTNADEAAFVARICEYPDEDGPRLIYADYLDERGDPRGAFIRVQCALAQIDADDPRRPELAQTEKALLAAHREQWVAPLSSLATNIELRRGLPEVVIVDASRFLKKGKDLFHLAPIRFVKLLDVGERLSKIAASPLLGRLAELSIAAQHKGDGLVRTLAESEQVSSLRGLHISRNGITDPGVEMLAQSARFANLQVLDLGDNLVSDRGAAALAASPYLRKLRTLELRNNELTLRGLGDLSRSQRMPELTVLGLRHNRMGSLHRYRGPAGETVSPVREIDLSENNLTPPSVEAFASMFPKAGLQVLELAANHLGDDGAQVLSTTAGLFEVRALGLSRNQIGDAGVRILAASGNLTRLTHLDVSNNPIHDLGARALLDARTLRGLRSLAIRPLGLTERTRRALAARFGAALGGG